MTVIVQLPVQLACRWRATSVSAGPCLPIDKLHARTRAARLPHGIGSSRQANLYHARAIGSSSFHPSVDICVWNRPPQRRMSVNNRKPRNSSLAETNTIVDEAKLKSAPPATGALVPPVRHRRSHRVTERIQLPPNGLGLSGYRNRSQVLPKSIDIESIPDGPPVTSASRQCKSQLGRVCTRALSRTNNSWKQTQAPARGWATGATPDDRRNLWEGRPDHLFKSRGSREENRRSIDTRHPFPLSRLPFRNLGRACPENLGHTLEPAALTQKHRRIRQIDPAARGMAGRVQNSPATISESWRGIRHE
jgi:hypothetical protein